MIEGPAVNDEMECTCQECGISAYFPRNRISLKDPANVEARLLGDLRLCPECGGRLFLVGKVGDEAHYSTT